MESDSDSDINVFGDSSEEEVSATIRASSERIPTKVVNDAVVRFVCGYKLYQVAVADVCDRNEALLYTEVMADFCFSISKFSLLTIQHVDNSAF
uniref:Uncharacterized protein n=1 Tax=Ditylenchus dipsaci TaxID=166011 RepID=A0A915DSB9_9BILA